MQKKSSRQWLVSNWPCRWHAAQDGSHRYKTSATVNTPIAQFAVPKRLLGVAVGAIFFFQMLGISVAPALLGLVQNSAPTLEGGLKLVFLVGAIATFVSLLMILAIPEIAMDAEIPEKSEPLKSRPVEGQSTI